ncbi:MAG: D-alanyl-D-alanine carboxypeptidase [Clostridia bacterium]|nr:D-alanyl-D-alanine carboxypeptidase [Clostridia bacterium]
MKKAIIFLTSILVFMGIFAPVGASALYNDQVETETEIFYIESLDTGTVLFEKNSLMRSAPASLTKIVTAIVALENCPDLETVITVKEECIRMLDGTGSSLAGLKPGEEISMKNLLYCLLVSSANEASTVIADYIGGGSVETFVQMMNDTAKKIGCKNTSFKNPHGLDEDGHYSCAQDMAAFAKYAMKFPIFNEITDTEKYTLPATNLQDERDLITTNKMKMKNVKEYYVPEVKGIKTGSTTNAGRCIVTTATKNGYSYLAVMMKGPFYDYDKDGYDENFAFMDCKAMLNWIFDNIRLKVVAEPTKIVTVVKVKRARKVDHLRLVPAENCVALVPDNVDSSSVSIEPIPETLPESVAAPIKKGEVMGKAIVKYANSEIARVDLVAAEDVELSYLLLVLIILAVVLVVGGGVAYIYVKRSRSRKSIRQFKFTDIRR